MAQGKTRRGKWWEVRTLLPGRVLDAVLWAGFAAAGFLLVLTIVGFAKASGRAKELATAEQQIETLSLRPTAKDLSDANAGAKEARDKLQREKDAEIESLGRKVEAAGARAGGLESDLKAAKRAHTDTKALNQGLGVRLKELEALYATARRSASGKEASLLDKLEASGKKVVDLEVSLARGKDLVAELIDEARKKEQAHKLALEEAKGEIDQRDALIKKLRGELIGIPVMPLPDDLAEEKYQEILNEVARHKDRELRIDLLFRAKLVLAGSSYESRADAAWRKEQRGKQNDIDRAARSVYGDVISRMRQHAGAHDENVRLLKEALEKIRGSSYEDRVRRLIDREHELKAQGR